MGVCLEGQSPGDSRKLFDDAIYRMERSFLEQEATSVVDAYYLGRAVAANIIAAYRPYTGNSELTRYLNMICQTIVINSAYPDLFNGYHVIILDSQDYNAFASPGGHIFITKGLVESTTSEDMLASIIAHELAHIMLKHGQTIIEDLRLHDEMSAMADQAIQFAGNSASARRLSYFRNSVAATVDALIKNGYSQEQEFDADAGAVVLLSAAGYNPIAFIEMLKVLQSVESSQKGGFSSTHPKAELRLENVDKFVNQYRIQDTRSFRTTRFKNK
jgi:predicted Zn-dependent protease